MKVVTKPVLWLYNVYAITLFIVTMFIVVPFVIAGLFMGKIRGGNLIYKGCRIWAYTWFFLTGMRLKNIYESPHDTSMQYIFVANHISYMDIPPIVSSINQPVRVLAKSELAKIPVFGTIYKSITVLVDRRDARHRAQSIRRLKTFLRKKVSIFIFPEGTFNETDAPLKSFFDGAFRIAIETQTPIKPLLFVDTADRMNHKGLLTITPGKCRVVYLEKVDTEGLTLADTPALKYKVHQIMEAGLRRYRQYPG